MNKHLTEDEIATWITGGASAGAAEHLETCGDCRTEVEELQQVLTNFHYAVHALADRPDAFWRRQRAEISERTLRRRTGSAVQWGLAGAVATAALAVVLLVHAPGPRLQPVAQNDPDDLLLLEVQNDIGRDVPMALAPAALILTERNRMSQNMNRK